MKNIRYPLKQFLTEAKFEEEIERHGIRNRFNSEADFQKEKNKIIEHYRFFLEQPAMNDPAPKQITDLKYKEAVEHIQSMVSFISP